MRTWKWIITASLLISFGAMAQQTTAPTSGAPAAAPQSAPQSIVSTPAPSAPAPMAAPTTMDQVVDRAILREHALITFLTTRTPLVETYLQNLKLDPQMGPAPREDHYFFGRLDLERFRRSPGLSFGRYQPPEKHAGRSIEAVQIPIQAHRFLLDDLRRPR